MASLLSSLRTLLPPLSVYTEDDDGPRHATWLELFFDLVFVVALARLGTALHHDLTLAGFGEFALLFFLLWWIWLSYSYAADLFGAEDAVSELTFLAAMAVVLFLTQAIPEATGATSFEFAAGTFVLRLLLTASFFRVWHIPSERPFIALDALTTAVWGLSLFVEPPGRVGIWVAAVLLNSFGMVVIYATVEEAVAQDSHFPERLGLFTIVVLGETVIAVSYGATVPLADLRTVVVAASGFAISVAAWWLYFWRYDERLLDRALRASDEERFEARQQGIAYVFSHYGIHAGIVAAGVGIAVAIESSLASHPAGLGALVALCGGVATFLLASSFCHRSISELIDRRMARTRQVLAVVFLLGVPVGTVVPSVVLVPAIALALLGLIVYEARLGPGSRPKPASEAG